jgi:hypothetical protein
MSKATKTALYSAFLCIAFSGVLVVLAARYQAGQMDARRKRDADAVSIGSALVIYRQHHGGGSPTSLKQLSFDRADVDVSPFLLLPAGSQVGKLDLDVLVTAPQGGNGKHKIMIYADGSVRWE